MNPLLFRPEEDALGGLLAGMTPQEAGNLAGPGLSAAGGLLSGLAAAAPGSLRRAWEGSDLRNNLQGALNTASYYAGPHLSNRVEAVASALPQLTPNFGTSDAQAAGDAFQQGQYGRGAGLMGLGVAGGLLDALPGEAAAKGILKGLTRAAHYAPDLSMAAAPMAMLDRSRLHEVPNVPQFDLPRNIPPRGVPARVQDITTDPKVRSSMLDTIESGKAMGGANWYNAEPLRERFVAELGQDAGDQAFRKYMDFVAATSPRSDVGTNVRNASYYFNRAMTGQGMPAVGDRNPAPYGHMAQRLHQMNAERVAGAGWDPLNNPKPASFVENLVGNQQPATIDTHAFRLPAILAQDPRFLETAYQTAKDAPKQNIQKAVESGALSIGDAVKTPAYWQAQPKANEYAAMEQYYQGLGKELGLTPAQTQASAWVGGGKLTGLASDESKPFLGFFEDRVNLTAQKTGMDPKDVLQKFIRGEMPLLALPAAAAGMGGLLGALHPDQQAP